MFPKIGGFYPQNGWLKNWFQTLLKWDDFGGGGVKPPLFLVQHPFVACNFPSFPFSTWGGCLGIFAMMVVLVVCHPPKYAKQPGNIFIR